MNDVRLESDQASKKCALLLKHGLRSMLRVPIRLEGVIVGKALYERRFSLAAAQLALAETLR